MSSPYPVLDDKPIDQWRVTELKEELKKRKLATKGLKDDLIRRLDEALRDEAEAMRIEAGSNDIEAEANDTEAEANDNEAEANDNEAEAIDNEAEAIDNEAEVIHKEAEVATEKVEAETTTNEAEDAMEKVEVEAVANEAEVATEKVEAEAIINEAEVIHNEAEVAAENVENSCDSIPISKVESEEVARMPAGDETVKDVIDPGDTGNGMDTGVVQVQIVKSTESLEKKVVQEVNVVGGTDSVIEEELVVHVTSVETSVSVVSELGSGVQESQSNEITQNESNDLKPQLENDGSMPHQEDSILISSDPRNQVSEVSPVLGFQVNSDSISTDSVSNNEKNELKDNIIVDNVTLELDVKPEIVEPSPSHVVPDGGKLHPMDVEEPREEKVSVEERDYTNAENAEMDKKIDIADVGSSEKLNLDRSSGDDSMEEDALESKLIDSKYNSDEVGHGSEKTEVPLKEENSIDAMEEDIPAGKRDLHGENRNGVAVSTVKRKIHDQEAVVGTNELSKRQRRWNSDSLKVPETQTNSLASSTTPKDTFPATVKRKFSRSDSTVSEDVPKERVVPPPQKPATNSLRIDRFLRPFTLKAVQELLGKTGAVTSFWMDHIKTHCYVTYSSVEEAIETRNAVYNLQWPPNGGRLLVAEFVDPQEVKLKVEAPPPPSPATPVSTGPTLPPPPPPILQQQPQPSPRQQVQVHRQQQQQQLPPPPPLPLPPPPPLTNLPPVRERLLPLPPPPGPPPTPAPEKVDPPIVTLDDLFRKTKATPRIYYLPLSDEQVAAKLKTQGKAAAAAKN